MNPLAHEELLSRLDHFSLAPRVIVDISGNGEGSGASLSKRFPKSRLISTGRPEQSKDGVCFTLSRLWRRKPRVEYLACNPEQIPLEDRSVDLIVAFDWSAGVDTLDAALGELHRILVSGGGFLCASRSAISAPGLADIHDFGSALMRAGFVEPVLDVDRYTSEEGEVIHVAAFAGSHRHQGDDGEFVVPVSKISRR